MFSFKNVCIFAAVFVFYVAVINNVNAAPSAKSENDEPIRDECGHTVKKPTGFIARHFDYKFWKKFLKHLNPFSGSTRVKMHFYLYKKDFPECGRVIDPSDDNTLEQSGFNADHQTRIVIHGWMSQAKGTWYRSLISAYLSLSREQENLKNSTNISDSNKIMIDSDAATARSANTSDFNIIIVDWSVISTNINYFEVVELIDDLGFLLAEFVRYLNERTGLNYDDIYLIGHSLGAQIAGSAGKQVKPFLFNTIYALDPAGPKFQNRSAEHRVDSTDAKYVESIQTSNTFGLQEPVGHASFYPNFGHDQKKCYALACSHKRSHDFFVESITSQKGFWGIRVDRQSEKVWVLSASDELFIMGGEPSTPKQGTFYVKTNDQPPYALGKEKYFTTQSLEVDADAKLVMN